ncbi:MAG TPA: hypothetical protein VFF74_06500 [Methylophilaceae bacterium]|nr:hypothetical protein [Methylophilaceae bacterium]
MPIPNDVDFFLSDKRKRKLVRRKQRKISQFLNISKAALYARQKFGNHSKLVAMVAKYYFGKEIQHNGVLKLNIPECFSIIENPEVVISTIGQFAKTFRTFPPRNIQIDHSRLNKYDLAANSLLDLIAVELKKETKLNRMQLRWQGIYPTDANIRRFIKALGIIKHLRLTHEYPSDTEVAALKLFDVRNRHYYVNLNPNKADKKTNVTTDFANHINACLQAENRSLTPDSRHKLCQYVSEILDNAEQHAGMVDWTIQGYLDLSCKVPFCEVAIFNFGNTIAENLGSVSKNSYTWQQIKFYILMHRAKKLFKPSWSENDLLTLIALQEKVSSKNLKETDTRGHGTVDLIEFFQKIYDENAVNGEKKAKMAILSGSTHILFDGKYKLSAIGTAPRRIAFNPQNDLTFPPDSDYVRGMKGIHFPGTIISIRFPLSIDRLTEIGSSSDASF